MVLDTSALVAILQAEPERSAMLEALAKAERRLVSAVTVLEASMVMEGRYGLDAGVDLELFLYNARTEIVPLDSQQAQTAMRAWRKFGKGRHPAQLNLGDCCVYALAKVSHEPVLCKGADFSRTDVPLVL
jgi:ribonuclease VapC